MLRRFCIVASVSFAAQMYSTADISTPPCQGKTRLVKFKNQPYANYSANTWQ
jgi:hypothetical protein